MPHLCANFKTFQFGQAQGGSEISTAGILGYSRIEISDQRRDWPKWGVLKLALIIILFSSAHKAKQIKTPPS